MKQYVSVVLFALVAVTAVFAQAPKGWKMRVDRSTSASDPAETSVQAHRHPLLTLPFCDPSPARSQTVPAEPPASQLSARHRRRSRAGGLEFVHGLSVVAPAAAP